MSVTTTTTTSTTAVVASKVVLPSLALTPVLAARKAELDEKFHGGTKASRATLMYANGVRQARESRGYGRAALAKALGITAAEYWVGEFVLPTGSKEAKALIAAIGNLPNLKAVKVAAQAAKKASVAKPVAKKASVAKPVASTDLI